MSACSLILCNLQAIDYLLVLHMILRNATGIAAAKKRKTQKNEKHKQMTTKQ